jgi:quinol monooxygenase YgiN
VLSSDPACVQYTVGVAGDDEVAVFELWESEAAHAASLQRPEIQEIITRGRPLIAGMGPASIRFTVRSSP